MTSPSVLAMVNALARRHDDLVETLTRIATRASAEDEIQRAMRTVAGAPWELRRNQPRHVDQVAVFLPSNNVLYSYVLFGFMPSLYAGRVLIRPSTRIRETAFAIHEILSAEAPEALRGVFLLHASQREFLQDCANADAIVFTGMFDNGVDVATATGRRPVLVVLGSGPNPFVVGPEADVDRAVDDAIEARLYNSGQDCLCPDVLFVHHEQYELFAQRLCERVDTLSVGDPRDAETLVAPLVYPDAVEALDAFLAQWPGLTLVGGDVDRHSGCVAPTVLATGWDPEFHPPELFGPVFILMPYEDAADVDAWLRSPEELRRGMYASVYGEPNLADPIVGTTTVLRDRITLDAEDGNAPFGGYGVEASAVREDDQLIPRPVLLSAELGRGTTRQPTDIGARSLTIPLAARDR